VSRATVAIEPTKSFQKELAAPALKPTAPKKVEPKKEEPVIVAPTLRPATAKPKPPSPKKEMAAPLVRPSTATVKKEEPKPVVKAPEPKPVVKAPEPKKVEAKPEPVKQAPKKISTNPFGKAEETVTRQTEPIRRGGKTASNPFGAKPEEGNAFGAPLKSTASKPKPPSPKAEVKPAPVVAKPAPVVAKPAPVVAKAPVAAPSTGSFMPGKTMQEKVAAFMKEKVDFDDEMPPNATGYKQGGEIAVVGTKATKTVTRTVKLSDGGEMKLVKKVERDLK